MSYTPGPWKCGKEEPFVYALNSAGTNRFFCNVGPGWITKGNRNSSDDERTSAVELMANARLIAAAPEAVALIERYLATADNPLGMSKIAEIDADARAILARIRGEK